MICFIPAHNEEDVITETVQGVLDQTVDVTPVVILDNCTDDTREVVEENFEDVEVFETEGNENRKAGALNQAWNEYREEWKLFRRTDRVYPRDFVICIDADTLLPLHFAEKAMEELESDERIGGVCGRFYARNRGSVIEQMQRLDYAKADHRRDVKDFRDVSVLSGSAVAFRNEALTELAKNHEWPGPWAEDSIVEDYKLTIDLKKLGWKAKGGREMKVKTTTPKTWGGLWNQRVRWTRGHFEHCFEEGFNERTYEVWKEQGKFFTVFTFKIIWILMILWVSFSSATFYWSWIWIIPVLMMLLDRVTSIYTIDDRDWIDYAVTLSIIPDALFRFFQEAWIFRSYYLIWKEEDKSW